LISTNRRCSTAKRSPSTELDNVRILQISSMHYFLQLRSFFSQDKSIRDLIAQYLATQWNFENGKAYRYRI
jgi:hypothetical protein